ncbi:DUF692 domain-containing protein [Terrimonas sp. NA20]|uniref:DUF692 domain-containing protein n=1 Tax=Terrimonas ginsenosidimutans TaxID=2908004 RepID=A0ABS9KMG2_9BACT|nr:DUF692 family multinuclear iron-containing protein [Terrimonas ginsenosidimutans]MCG2613499.1 DUF692 domain-containing protein [Terrimonas ginsenosidimutans]
MNTEQLGIGILYNAALPEYLKEHFEQLDYIEIIPDMFWSDEGRGKNPRFRPLPKWMRQLDWIAGRLPLVAHNIGISIGTIDYFDEEYIRFMQKMHERYQFKWHSDHLSFLKLPTKGPHDHNAGIAIPVPYDEEYLEMIGKKVDFIQSTIEIPFLLENNVYFVEYPEQDYTETAFVNKLVKGHHCNILLDIHNLYTNAINQGTCARTYIDELDMSAVMEMHIAGGNDMNGFYMDSHAGPCPDEVWELLDYAVSKAPNLRGITFEFHESYFPLLQFGGLNRQIELARNTWNKYHHKKPAYECA